jgi:hypothetical protein
MLIAGSTKTSDKHSTRFVNLIGLICHGNCMHSPSDWKTISFDSEWYSSLRLLQLMMGLKQVYGRAKASYALSFWWWMIEAVDNGPLWCCPIGWHNPFWKAGSILRCRFIHKGSHGRNNVSGVDCWWGGWCNSEPSNRHSFSSLLHETYTKPSISSKPSKHPSSCHSLLLPVVKAPPHWWPPTAALPLCFKPSTSSSPASMLLRAVEAPFQGICNVSPAIVVANSVSSESSKTSSSPTGASYSIVPCFISQKVIFMRIHSTERASPSGLSNTLFRCEPGESMRCIRSLFLLYEYHTSTRVLLRVVL